jgi:hypothetical protein
LAPSVISDGFGSAQIDGTIWYQIREGTGWDFSQYDGHLEFAFAPGTTPGPPYGNYGGHLGTLCKFPGDFDARVDYALLTWPESNGTIVMLGAFFTPGNLGWQVSRRSSPQGGEQYASYTGPGVGASVSLDDAVGTLRLVRHRGVVTAYFLHSGKWISLTSGSDTSYATIAIGAGGDGPNATFGGQQVVVDFDNFHVTAANPVCPPGSRPP